MKDITFQHKENRLRPEVATRIEKDKKDWEEGRRENFSKPLTDTAKIDTWLNTRAS
ncbi:MAG: hypothetical protein OXB96_00335 [Candidatus Kaiserbacteria bacterium]|nr:hypothetical protein [Candidatus Kaiserbacteria bacterium]